MRWVVVALGLALAGSLRAGPVGVVECPAPRLTWQDAPTQENQLAPGDPVEAGQWIKGVRDSGGVVVQVAPGARVHLRTTGPAVFRVEEVSPPEGEGLPGRVRVLLRRGPLLVCAPEVPPGTQVEVRSEWGRATLDGPGMMGVRSAPKRGRVVVFRGLAWTLGAYEHEDQRRAVPAGTRGPIGAGRSTKLTPRQRENWLDGLVETGCPEECLLPEGPVSPRPAPPAP